MKVKFCGANKTVTGSRHLLKINGKNILLDCGMFQGHRAKEYQYNLIFPFDPKTIDWMLLSHAHIDHCGDLPPLVTQGYDGPIICTFATRDLAYHMLLDSAYVQEQEAEYINKKLAKHGVRPIEAIYTIPESEKALQNFQGINYKKSFNLTPEIKVTYYDAGHILGSAQIYFEIEDKEKGDHKTFLFTGDLGHKGLPILRDPYQIPEADYVITESTYGNRVHESMIDAEKKLKDVINTTAARGGKIIIPAFSLGRTQEVVYALHRLLLRNEIPDLAIYVDSPLSVNVTEVFKNHRECFDEEVNKEFIDNAKNPFGFGRLKYISSVEESKSLNTKHGPYILIAASGMCEHGRIIHHLKNNIEDQRNTVLTVGYMAQNTLGRRIVEKQPTVNIFGSPYRLKAEVASIDAFSAHADRSDLIDYLTHVKGLKQVFLVHGEAKSAEDLTVALKENGVNNVMIPNFGDEIEI